MKKTGLSRGGGFLRRKELAKENLKRRNLK